MLDYFCFVFFFVALIPFDFRPFIHPICSTVGTPIAKQAQFIQDYSVPSFFVPCLLDL